MERKQIKIILLKQIFISFLKVFKFVVIGALLLYWGMNSEALGYIVLMMYLFLVVGIFLQSKREKNKYLAIYKSNSYSKENALILVNSYIEYYEGLSNPSKNGKFNKTVTQETMRTRGFSSSKFAFRSSSDKTNRVYSGVQIDDLDEKYRKRYLIFLNKELKVLNELQELLEAITKPQDAWDI